MSQISNRHSVVPFVAGKTNPLNEQRLSKVGYKTTKNVMAKFPSIAVSVPKITELDVDQIERMTIHIVTLLENAQDGIIKSLYESSEGNLTSVSDDDISIDACIAFMDAESNGSRLTKEIIQRWFDSDLQDNLTAMIGEKLGFNEPTENQLKVIATHVKTYRDVISMLAGGKTMLAETQLKGVKNALILAADSEITAKLNARIVAMERKPDIAELLEL